MFWAQLGPKINKWSIYVTELSPTPRQSLKIDKKAIQFIICRKCPLLANVKEKTKSMLDLQFVFPKIERRFHIPVCFPRFRPKNALIFSSSGVCRPSD